MLFLGLPWIILHYITKWKTTSTLTTSDERTMEELYELARRLDDRVRTVERIVTDRQPGLAGDRLRRAGKRRRRPQRHDEEDQMIRGRKFTLDRANGKLMGVCAGIADATGWDATLIRVGFVIVTLAGGFPWTLIAYFAAALIGKPKAADRYDRFDRFTPRPASTAELKRSTTDLDRRLAEIETYVTSQNNSLAREIESLR